jgi:hypothetical protein
MALGVNIISEFDAKGINKAIRDFKKLETAGEKTAFALRSVDAAAMKMGKALLKFGAIGAGVGAIVGKKLVDAASNLEESQSKVNVVFGAGSAAVTKFASNTAKSMGISKQAALEATGTYGNLIQAFGLGQDKAQTMSTTLVQLAGDLASFNNTSVEDALVALRSGLSGEAEPLKRYGVAINDVRMKEEARAMGLYNGSGVLSTSAKLQAAYALILKDTTLAQGDYARTADGVANSQRTVAAQFQDVQAVIGTALIPAYKSILGYIQDKVLPVFQEFARLLGEQGVGAAFRYLGTSILDGIANLGAVGKAVLILTGLFVALRVATITYTAVNGALTVLLPIFATSLHGATAAQTGLNVAMKANTIGLIIAGVAAVIAILVMLYVKFEVVRKVINFVINSIIAVIENWLNTWIKVINVVISGINLLIKGANLFGAGLKTLGKIGEVEFGRVGAAATTAKASIGGVAEVAGAFAAKEGGTSQIVKAAESFTNLGTTAGGAGKQVETAKEKLGKFVDALKGVTSAQKSYRDSTKSALKADSDLVTAKNKLVEAQTKFNNVLNGYGKDSKQAKDGQTELGKAQRDAEKAGYNLEGAIFSVAKAETDLAKIRANPESSPQDIREAEIALAEAKLSVADATDAQKESVDALAKAQTLLDEAINGAKTSSDTFKDAATELKDAQDAEREATDQQTDAYERQKDMLDALNESTKKAIILKGGVVPKKALEAEKAAGISVGNGLYGSFMQAVRALHPNAKSLSSSSPLADSRKAFPKLYAEYKAAGLAMAQGGIVTQPTQILAGESGAEAIIPLDRLQSGSTINITVNAGMGSDGTRIGQMIVDELQAYQRRVGSLPLKVSA